MSIFKEKIELGLQEAELETQKTLGGLPFVFRWLVILVIVGLIPAYFIAKGVSYRLWIGRFEQGAVMAKPSFSNPQAPKLSPIYITTLGSGQYAAVTQVSNQNLNLAADNIPVEFDFYNSQSQKIYSYDANFFLLPDQTKYLTVPTFSPTQAIASSTIQLLANIPWQKRLQIPQVSLTTSLPATSYQTSPEAFVVQGDFTNNSPYTLGKVELTFVIYGTNGQIVGASSRDEFTVAPFERRAYRQLWPNSQVTNLGRVDVTADTDTLDPNNLTTAGIAPSSASDLSHPGGKNQ